MVDEYEYFVAILIAIVIIAIVFGIKGCVKHQATQETEKCIDTCPVNLNTDKDCVQKCFDYVQFKTKN